MFVKIPKNKRRALSLKKNLSGSTKSLNSIANNLSPWHMFREEPKSPPKALFYL